MAGTIYSPRRRLNLSAVAWLSLIALVAAGTNGSESPPAAANEEAAAEPKGKQPRGTELGEGRLIRVRLPLVGNADEHIKSAIERALDQLTKSPHKQVRRPILVLEITPARRQGGAGEGTDFERALSLARYLTSPELAAVKTVAYIPRTIKGHGVLVALACEEIVMDPDAEIGEAGVDQDKSGVGAGTVGFYREIAKAKLTVPEAIALGMLDRRLEVLKVETDDGTSFVLRDDLDKLKQDHTIVSQDILVPRGSLGSFTGREGREYGFVKLLASNRDDLARGLALPPDAVLEDQSLVGNWRPVIIDLDGPITPRRVRQVKTLIGSEIKDHHVNWIGVRIDSTGGEMQDCLQLAAALAELDANEVRTVAFVPVEASGGAAIVALACDQLVMQPSAHVGGKGTLELDRGTIDDATKSIRDSLAGEADSSWSLMAATIDPELAVFSFKNTKTGEVRYFSVAEAEAQPDSKDWQQGAKITTDHQPLRLDSKLAEEMGVAAHVVDGYDELKQLYGLDEDPRVAQPNWALELVEALASPPLRVILLVIGFIGIYIELHSPGTAVGGFVSAVAFMLFFWSNYLHATAGWLEILLFLGGVFCVLLEVLVLPGFGIFGLGGGAMILASIVLASQTFILPHTASQLAELRQSLTVIAAAAACVVVGALMLRRYLPRAPLFNKIMLQPPEDHELDDLDYRESLADYSHLVGQHGTAATNLMPSGKAEFDGQLVDVISDGMPIDRGAAVVVVKTRGNRVVVRAVEA